MQQAQAAAAQYTQIEGATAASSLKLGSAFTHPLLTTLAQPAQTIASTLETSAITDFAQAMGLRQKLVKLAPKNAGYQLALARDANATQSYATVATALQAYVTLSPNLSKAAEEADPAARSRSSGCWRRVRPAARHPRRPAAEPATTGRTAV